MKACRYEYGITSCFVRCGALPGEDCLPWLRSKPEALQLFTPPPTSPAHAIQSRPSRLLGAVQGREKQHFPTNPRPHPSPGRDRADPGSAQGPAEAWCCPRRPGTAVCVLMPTAPRRVCAWPGMLPGLGEPCPAWGALQAPWDTATRLHLPGWQPGQCSLQGLQPRGAACPLSPCPGHAAKCPMCGGSAITSPGQQGCGWSGDRTSFLLQNKRILMGRISGILVLTALRMPQFPYP